MDDNEGAPYLSGYEAGFTGVWAGSNPYSFGDTSHYRWIEGHRDGHRERINGVKIQPKTPWENAVEKAHSSGLTPPQIDAVQELILVALERVFSPK